MGLISLPIIAAMAYFYVKQNRRASNNPGLGQMLLNLISVPLGIVFIIVIGFFITENIPRRYTDVGVQDLDGVLLLILLTSILLLAWLMVWTINVTKSIKQNRYRRVYFFCNIFILSIPYLAIVAIVLFSLIKIKIY
jgi:hypothetical protein